MDWFRQQIEREFVVEADGWAHERVARVDERLQRGVAAGDLFETLVIWWDAHNAFTVPGKSIYLSRRLLERIRHDDAAAFVIAHEIAHHRLGHVPDAALASQLLPLRIAIALISRRITGPEQEQDADLLAIEMCLEAGYDLERCCAALELLREIALDYGDVEGALGPEPATRWLWSRRRGYFSVAERIAAVRAHAARYARGERLSHTITRDRRRRRRLAVAGAVAAAAAAVLLLGRRRM